MIGRTGFVGDLLYSVCVSGFIYPIIGHWAWGPDGLLATMGSDGHFFPSLGMGFHDFAGSTVVHTIGGMIALAGAIVLGPRLGRKFKRDGGGPMLPHDLTIAVSGGLILWFGWYGFNPGSTLSAMDFVGIGRVAANTTLAACAAGLTSMFYGLHESQEMGRQLHHQRISGRAGGDYLPLLLGQSDGCDRARRNRRRVWSSWASSSWSGCASMIPSARFRYTASAESGERCRWACLPAGQYGATGPISPDNSAPLERIVLRRRTAGAQSSDHRQRDRHRGDIRGCHGGDARRQRDGDAALCRQTWRPTVWIFTSTAFRLTRNTSFPPWVRLAV